MSFTGLCGSPIHDLGGVRTLHVYSAHDATFPLVAPLAAAPNDTLTASNAKIGHPVNMDVETSFNGT